MQQGQHKVLHDLSKKSRKSLASCYIDTPISLARGGGALPV
jgi:hypothetical protein